jgi:ABC-type Fe3+-hydroxamate transport system substrate-binding protein
MSLTSINERQLTDALGTRHQVAGAQARIVSLVPSITELLFDLDLAPKIVGRTGFCIHPKDRVKRVAKVGGTKSIEIGRIKRLAPTHLIVNIDENPRATVEALARFVPHVIVTHPLEPRDNLMLYRLLGRIFSREEQAEELCQRFERGYEEMVAATVGLPRRRVLYLIWKSPWMTVARDTYISRMLAQVNWHTLPACDGGEQGAARYPVLQGDEPWLTRVQQVLLSSEPYAFRAQHLDLARALCPQAQVRLVDGELISWYGPRAAAGLRYLRALAGAESAG